METFKLEAEIDATDQLEFPDQNRTAVQHGIHAATGGAGDAGLSRQRRAASRTMRWPAGGTLEIVPMEAPLALFVWSKHRVVPVRITEFSVTEEAFDPLLNPIRARVSLGLRVLSVDDLGFATRAAACS